MAVYLFTYHAFGTWMPDRSQGFVQKGKGLLPPDEKLAERYRRLARHETVQFDPLMRQTLVDASRQICDTKDWRLHRVEVIASHIHLLVSWRQFIEWKSVSNTFKRCLGIELSKALNRKGPWFSRGCSRKRVRDRKHFNHLMQNYLPNHHGTFWQEPDG
jgi:REP element-mobilizing transposase RayT